MILRAPEKERADKVPGGWLEALVHQDVCDTCRVRLEEFARGKGLSTIEAHVPERPDWRSPKKMASPKTMSRSTLAELQGRSDQPIRVTS